MRADKEPWLVPMRIARFRLLHFSTRGVKTSLQQQARAPQKWQVSETRAWLALG